MNCIAKLVFASLVGAGLFAGMNVQAAQKPAAASKPGKAAIASSHQLATDAGLEILAKVAMPSMRPLRSAQLWRWSSRKARGLAAAGFSCCTG